jgi:molybdopterin-guanine dinucleotide biosynthesis protein B
VAIAADAHVATDLPLLDLNDPNAIADFIMQWLQQQRANLKLVSSR